MADTPDTPPAPQDPPSIQTWAALLAHWVSFARSAGSLPEQGATGRLRASVADLIALQAVWCALGEWASLPSSQRSVALDRAGLMIEQHTAALRARYGDEPMPQGMLDLLRDARERHEACVKIFIANSGPRLAP